MEDAWNEVCMREYAMRMYVAWRCASRGYYICMYVWMVNVLRWYVEARRDIRRGDACFHVDAFAVGRLCLPCFRCRYTIPASSYERPTLHDPIAKPQRAISVKLLEGCARNQRESSRV